MAWVKAIRTRLPGVDCRDPAITPQTRPWVPGFLGASAPRGRWPPLGLQLPNLALRRLAVELGQALLELRNPLRERLDRIGERIRQVDPVRVRPLDLASLDADRMARVPHDGGVGRHVGDDDRVRTDLGAAADLDRAEELGPGADRDAVGDRRVPLSALEARAAQRDALVEGHAVADLSCLAD